MNDLQSKPHLSYQNQINLIKSHNLIIEEFLND